jgi:hypothetical protein
MSAGDPAGIGQQRKVAGREIDVFAGRREDTGFDNNVPAAVQIRREDLLDVARWNDSGADSESGGGMVRRIVVLRPYIRHRRMPEREMEKPATAHGGAGRLPAINFDATA